MNMNSTQSHDEALQQLFHQLPEERPSADFSQRVMGQIMLRAQHTARRRHVHRIAWMISIPSAVALFTMAGWLTRNYWIEDFLRFCDPLFISIGNALSSISTLFADGFGSPMIMPGMTALALLLGDLFIRRYAEKAPPPVSE